jgi:ATP-dependent helicase HrpB
LANGRGAQLSNGDALSKYLWLVAAQLDASGSEGRVWLAAPANPADLNIHLAGQIQTVQAIVWDERQAAVNARSERRFGALLLESAALTQAQPASLRQAMLVGIRQLGLDTLPWTAELRDWQARLLSLRHWFPEEDWPELSDEWLTTHLEMWLEPWLDGVTRRDHLATLDLQTALQALLDPRARVRLNELAPTHWQAPSGSRIRLRYAPGEAPVIAVKLQELFGLADTPRIAAERIPVTLHLLSPAQRPIQVTQDLRGFWERTYAEVKKELKGRYPKHPWPDDPWSATPTRSTQSRLTSRP